MGSSGVRFSGDCGFAHPGICGLRDLGVCGLVLSRNLRITGAGIGGLGMHGFVESRPHIFGDYGFSGFGD